MHQRLLVSLHLCLMVMAGHLPLQTLDLCCQLLDLRLPSNIIKTLAWHFEASVQGRTLPIPEFMCTLRRAHVRILAFFGLKLHSRIFAVRRALLDDSAVL